MVWNWDGTITNNFGEGLVNLHGLVKDDTAFVSSLRKYLINHYLGMSVLKGGGSLIETWDEIEEELIRKGVIAVLKYEDQYFLADVITNEQNIFKKNKKVVLQLVDNGNIKFSTDKNNYQKILSNGAVASSNGEYEKLEEHQFVIFKNNREQMPYLIDFEYYAQKLVNVIRKFEMDMFLSEKKLMFILPEQPSEEDIDYLVQTFQKGVFMFVNFEKSANPSKEGARQGKQGINPRDVKFEVYEPKTDRTESFVRKFNFWWNKLLTISGIRHDVLAEKEERANVIETRASGTTFDAFEKRAWKWRMKGIREYELLFNEKSANYQLIYGNYGLKQ